MMPIFKLDPQGGRCPFGRYRPRTEYSVRVGEDMKRLGVPRLFLWLCTALLLCGGIVVAGWRISNLGVSSSGPGPELVEEAAGYFIDRTSTSGIDFTYKNGQEADHYAILESI